MFGPGQWCSVETWSKKTSQLLYHLELFKWVQQLSSYDNSSLGVGGVGGISLRIHGPIVFLNREKELWPNSVQIQPPAPHVALCCTKHMVMLEPPVVTAPLSTSCHPSAGLKKYIKPTGRLPEG